VIKINNLPEKLRSYRKEAGLTQQQVADAIGMNRSAYAYYEVGKSSPKLSVLKKISELYNTTVDKLLEEKQESDILQAANPLGNLEWDTTDKFNELSDFEKSVLLKVRLMSTKEKEALMNYLCK
jgi:transcriptional regulator with XRE-family HTH domain